MNIILRALVLWLLLIIPVEAQQASIERLLDTPPLGVGQSSGAAAISLTPSATANTKGAYTTLIASTTSITKTLVITINTNTSQTPPGGYGWISDIATGAAASEVVIVPNLETGVEQNNQFNSSVLSIVVPVNIPAGTRIAARTQTNIASSTDHPLISVAAYPGGFGAIGVDAISTSATTSLGTAVTAGNGSKGSYAQLTASSANAYKGLFVQLDPAGSTGSGAFTVCTLDISIGAAASEVVLISNLQFYDNSGFSFYPTTSGYLPVSVPAGTRFAARAQCNGVAANFGINLYGVY